MQFCSINKSYSQTSLKGSDYRLEQVSGYVEGHLLVPLVCMKCTVAFYLGIMGYISSSKVHSPK